MASVCPPSDKEPPGKQTEPAARRGNGRAGKRRRCRGVFHFCFAFLPRACIIHRFVVEPSLGACMVLRSRWSCIVKVVKIFGILG